MATPRCSSEVVPFAVGRSLAAAIPRAAFHPIASGHHNDLFSRHRDTMISLIAAHADR